MTNRTSRLRSKLLRWSQHTCRTIPQYTPVQYDMPCRCGWHVTGVMYADTDGDLLARMGAPMRKQDLRGPVLTLLDHYDTCPSREAESTVQLHPIADAPVKGCTCSYCRHYAVKP